MTFGERAGQKPATSFPDLPSLGAPLLSEPRRVKSFPSVFVEEPEGVGLLVNSPAASAMRHGQGCRSWHHHTFFFLAGVLCSFVVFSLSSHFAHLPDLLSRPTVWGGPPPASSPLSSSCQAARAQGVALSPMALANMSGNTIIPDRLIVAARHTDDTSWLDIYLSEVPHIVYQVDDVERTVGAQHATLVNKGNEAMAYLQFIIDYYDRLPASIVMLHGHRGTWHLKDHVPLLQRLQWGALPFANLRFANGPKDRLDWECGNRTDIPANKDFDCNWVGNWLRPGHIKPRFEKDLTFSNKDEWWDSVELEAVWPQTFEQELGPLPSDIQAPCCAEFMVSRERILAHPRAFYVHLRDWIVNTEIGRYRSGRVFEYMWHVIFGEPTVIEPVPECELLYCDDDVPSVAAE